MKTGINEGKEGRACENNRKVSRLLSIFGVVIIKKSFWKILELYFNCILYKPHNIKIRKKTRFL